MSKRKAPKFNSVLEDFRRFIGEKAAEESQGKTETSVAKGTSDSEVTEAIPGGGKNSGSNTDKGLNMGVDATQKAPGTKEPQKEEPSRKECSPSSKIAEDGSAVDLVNKLLGNIKAATEEIEKQEKEAAMPPQLQAALEAEGEKKEKSEDSSEEKEEEQEEEDEKEEKEASEKKEEDSVSAENKTLEDKEAASVDPKKNVSEAQAKLDVDADGAIESEDLKKLRESKKNKSASEETEIDEDRLAEKIATHYRNVSVGYELGKFLFQSLHDKLAAEGDEAPAEAAPAEAAPAEQAPAGGGSEIDLILQALQELVQEGQITEEQAQQVLMQLQSSVDGGAAPEAPAEAPMEEEPKTAGDLFTEENIAEIEANINSKVAEWVSEGKTDKEITELVKQAAEQDAQFLIDQRNNDSIERNLERKCAALAELGYSEKDIEEYVKAAKEQNEFSLKVDELVSQKVAELQSLGYTETQIDEYLKEAAKEDAKLIKEAQEQEQIKGAILNKVAEERKNKLANVPPEIQQILQALESLLQSGQITEEEAMLVLQELGLTGESAGAEAGAAPGADPAAAAPSPEQAAIPA